MDQIKRIQTMEEIMEKSEATLELLHIALVNYEEIKQDLQALEDYYHSDLWRKDYRDDECGKLPKDLKRGVLSEDGIWDLLSEKDYLYMKMKQLYEEEKSLYE